MTPTPPSSPEGSGLPPRHRPNSGNLAKDTTENDLWAFDELDPTESEPRAPVAREGRPASIPAPRDRGRSVSRPSEELPKPTGKSSINVNVGKARAKEPTANLRSAPSGDFDDLDSWDQTGPEAPFAEPAAPAPLKRETPVVSPTAHTVSPVIAPTDTTATVPTPGPTPVPSLDTMPVAPAEDDDEFTPHPKADAVPVTLKMIPKLSKLETIGLLMLVLMLLGGAGGYFLFTINHLPKGEARVKTNDFPIKRKKLTILSADSYWRAPQASDTSRRGTLLLPVIDLKVQGGPAALRVLFRNSDGESVGDAITRPVPSGGEFSVAATAGFDDYGMNAAYRTGEAKPWTIEVREAPSEAAQPGEFERLFEMDISTDRR